MPLVDRLLILAIAAQVLLTLFLLVRLGFERVPRFSRGEVDTDALAVDSSGWHHQARLLSNSFDSQFQLPVLFFVGALLPLQLGLIDWFDVVLGWLFVGLRFAHAAIHITTNNVPRRFAVFTAGLAVLAVFWLWLVIRILILPST